MSSAQCRYSKNSRFLFYKLSFVEPLKDLSIGAKYFSNDKQHTKIDAVYINNVKEHFNINNFLNFVGDTSYIQKDGFFLGLKLVGFLKLRTPIRPNSVSYATRNGNDQLGFGRVGLRTTPLSRFLKLFP